MPVDPELAHHRAQKAARHRWGGDTETPGDALEQAAVDRVVDRLVESWHNATPEQKARVRRLYNQPEPVR